MIKEYNNDIDENWAIEVLDYMRMIYKEGIYEQEHVDIAIKMATKSLLKEIK